MNQLDPHKRALILRCLTEGNSVRATCRLTGVAKGTVIKLVVEFGEFAEWFQGKRLVNLPCQNLQLDEIWAFCGCKEKNKSSAINPQVGDIWTWTALCRDTKLVPSWLVADRGHLSACQLVDDLASRLANRVQISTDGHRAYIYAIKGAFREEVDYGRLVKVYGTDAKGNEVVIRADKVPTIGAPDMDMICTSHVERQNLTMRMGMRRFTRLTNGFSKKAENHAAMVAIHFLNYNMIRKHQSLKTAPAVAAGVIDKPMTMLEAAETFEEFRAVRFPVDRPKNYRPRANRQTFEPVTPLTPWYLDKDSGGPNPPVHERKAGIQYDEPLG
jgi:IS1 family transposase